MQGGAVEAFAGNSVSVVKTNYGKFRMGFPKIIIIIFFFYKPKIREPVAVRSWSSLSLTTRKNMSLYPWTPTKPRINRWPKKPPFNGIIAFFRGSLYSYISFGGMSGSFFKPKTMLAMPINHNSHYELTTHNVTIGWSFN